MSPVFPFTFVVSRCIKRAKGFPLVKGVLKCFLLRDGDSARQEPQGKDRFTDAG